MNRLWLLAGVLCVCGLVPQGTAQADLQADWDTAISAGTPLHWYKFNESTGTDCLDAGSGKLNGAYDGPKSGQPGLLGETSAAVFDRATGTGRANFAGAANLTGPWTVEYIVMSTKAPAANDSMALHDSDTTSVRLAGWSALGEVGFTLYGVADYQFTPSSGYTLQNLTAPKDQWIHLVFRNTGAGTQVFVNGELMGTSPDRVDLPRLRIGGRGAGPVDWLQGVLDEAVVFNRALTDQEILTHAKVTGLAAVKAKNPAPANGDLAVSMPLFQWKAGITALLHNVYFGTSPELTEANLVSARQPAVLYYYFLGLQPGTTYYWRVDEIDKDGVSVYTGDVWTFTAQDVIAYHPTPADGSVDNSVTPVLTWMPGQAAVKHHLYFGDSSEAVAQGAAGADKGELTDPTFTPEALESLSTYYWRVDENILGGTVKAGPVWQFSTCLPIDDFESYTDDLGTAIFDTWVDGYGTNWSSGSTVGYADAPFAEKTVVHGGLQSMPLDYNNTKQPYYSEAESAFTPAQDWTVDGAGALVLYVRGRAANTPASLYVAVQDSANNSAVVVHPDQNIVKAAQWTAWKIPLSDFAGVNMAKVKSLVLGVGDRQATAAAGAGLIYIDDIRLTKP